MEIARDDLRDPVLEAFPFVVRERQVVGIGAHAKGVATLKGSPYTGLRVAL